MINCSRRLGIVVTEPSYQNVERLGRCWWVVCRSGLQPATRVHYSTLAVSCVLCCYSLSFLLFKMRREEECKEITNTVITQLTAH